MNSPQVKFLIEESVFGENLQPIIDAIKDQGMVYELTKYVPFSDETSCSFKPEDCVVVLGSINLIRQIQKTKPWIPGTFCNFQNFDCMNYYPYFGKNLFNRRYVILPLEEVKRRYMQNSHVFIRPCSGAKQFTGQVLDHDSLVKNQDSYGPPNLPVVVSPELKTETEFRFFCSGNKVIGGSQYYNAKGELEPRNIDEIDTLEKIYAVGEAESLLKDTTWRPDKIFCMDIHVEKKGSLHGPDFWLPSARLVEINSFSCSGWYATNPGPVIAEAARLAQEEWLEINNI